MNFVGKHLLYAGARRQLKEFNIKGCREVRFSCGGAVFAAANGTSVHLYATYTCELLGVMRCACSRVSSSISLGNETDARSHILLAQGGMPPMPGKIYISPMLLQAVTQLANKTSKQ